LQNASLKKEKRAARNGKARFFVVKYSYEKKYNTTEKV
jgi:hypothetical protein